MKRQQYVELEIHGPAGEAVGFIEGFRAGTGDDRPVWYSDRENVDLGSLIELLREKMSRDLHVVLARDSAESVARALGESRILHLEVASLVEVDYAELSFECRCYSRTDAESMRRVVEESLPEGVSLEDYQVEERVDEEARGLELYSPTHHYVVFGGGRYVGDVAGIFELAHRLEDQDFIHPGRIRLHHPS